MRRNQSSPARKFSGTIFNIMCCVDASSVPPLCCVSCFFFLQQHFTHPYLFAPLFSFFSFHRWEQFLDIHEEVAASLSSECLDFMLSLLTDSKERCVICLLWIVFSCEVGGDDTSRRHLSCHVVRYWFDHWHFHIIMVVFLWTDWAKAGWMKSCSTNGSQVRKRWCALWGCVGVLFILFVINRTQCLWNLTRNPPNV